MEEGSRHIEVGSVFLSAPRTLLKTRHRSRPKNLQSTRVMDPGLGFGHTAGQKKGTEDVECEAWFVSF